MHERYVEFLSLSDQAGIACLAADVAAGDVAVVADGVVVDDVGIDVVVGVRLACYSWAGALGVTSWVPQ